MRIIRPFLLLLGLTSCHIFNVLSQNSYIFKHFNHQGEISSNTVQTITQDKEDFIWIGTDNGLFRFDGYSFKAFTNISEDNTSIASNFICAIKEDTTRNCLWMITPLGVSKFDKTSHLFKNYNISSSTNSLNSPYVRGSICTDNKGNVWIEGFGNGHNKFLYKYDSKSDQFKNISQSNLSTPKNITSICIDKNQCLWVGSNHGLFFYHSASDTFKAVAYSAKNTNELHINTLFADDKNRLWIGTRQNSSLYLCENQRISKYYEPDIEKTEYNWISCISSFRKDILVAGVRDFGLLTLNLSTGESEYLQPDLFNSNGIKSKNPLCMHTDRFGNLWIGSYKHGLSFIDRNRKLFDHYQFNFTQKGLLTNNVRALFQDSDGEIWIGTKEGGGISKFNQKQGIFNNYKADNTKPNWIDNDIIISINELEKDKLLIGTYGSGIYTYHKNYNNFSKFSTAHNNNNNSISNNYVYAIYKDNDGKIWIGTNSNVDIYDTNTKKFSHLNDIAYARCFIDIGNSILIGTWSNSIFQYNKKNKVTSRYKLKDSTLILDKKTRINGFAKGISNNIWIATSEGLIKHDYKKKTNQLYTEQDGLRTNYICAVLCDKSNNIWVSSKNGLSKLNTATNIFKNYTYQDGLQSNTFEEFVSLKTNDGHLLFSGTNGFNIFHPDSIKDNLNIPKVSLIEMLILNKPVKIGEPNSPLSKHISLTNDLELTYEQSSFSFEFTGINYTSTENNKYLFKLKGYDNEWQTPKHGRIATYTRVPPGDYTFKVIASNNDDIWNKEGVSVNIKIHPPFWKSKIAFVIYFTLILLFLVLFSFIITYRINHENKLKLEILEKKRIEKEGKNRLNFFTNISHELRTPLTLISSPLENLVHYKTKDKQLIGHLKSMNRNAQQLLRLINQLMDYRSIEENRIKLRVSFGDLISDSKQILDNFSYLAQKKNINLQFINKTGNLEFNCWYDLGILEKVLFNLLSNAIKFTNNEGAIDLSILNKNGKVAISVKDNGIGISKTLIDKIFDPFYTTDFVNNHHTGTGIGLSFTKSLTDLHHGNITVESTLNNGSCFTITIPIEKIDYSEEELHTTIKKQNIISVDDSILPDTHKVEVDKKRDTLLIAEDNDDLRNYLLLNFPDYNIIECKNGDEALRFAKDKMPDIILSDIIMPGMNGLELCDSLKSCYITSHIPIVLLTARTSIEQKMEGFKHHADAYIEKPFSINLVRFQINNLLQLRKNIKIKFKEKNIINTIEDNIDPIDELFLNKVSELIQSKIADSDLSVENLSSALGMSRSQLFRKFKTLMDTTPSQFIRITRLNYASELLKNKNYNVNDVTFLSGFSDVSHFISLFKNHFGQTPKQFSENYINNQAN